MKTNLDRYRKDLDDLILKGNKLHLGIQLECIPKEFKKEIKDYYGEKADQILKDIPSFSDNYQAWYSEAQVLIKQLLPDRLPDFIHFYEKPKGRTKLSFENYRIEDTLQGLNIYRGSKILASPASGIPHFRQQLAILLSAKSRFDSSLFNIRELVQADLFDSELEAAKELLKNKFTRASGALAGVVLERHLSQVCENHNIQIRKKDPNISVFNDALKENEIIGIPDWRFIQHLADIRNLCDHNKKSEPSIEQVDDLILGVMKIIKTIS